MTIRLSDNEAKSKGEAEDDCMVGVPVRLGFLFAFVIKVGDIISRLVNC